MSEAMLLEYRGRGVGGGFAVDAWLTDAADEDLVRLADMSEGVAFEDCPYGLQDAYRELAGEDRHHDPGELVFRDRDLLLAWLKRERPFAWEKASGQTIRCDDTTDMFEERP